VQVKIIVNFNLPIKNFWGLDYDTYLHRIGLTGRFGKKGIALTLLIVTPI